LKLHTITLSSNQSDNFTSFILQKVIENNLRCDWQDYAEWYVNPSKTLEPLAKLYIPGLKHIRPHSKELSKAPPSLVLDFTDKKYATMFLLTMG